MNRLKLKRKHLWKFYLFPLIFFTTATCYPTAKPNLEQPEIRDEKHFPNGTVVGRYTYTDNDGNPIQVKYYADDASYGVELKSIKVVDSLNEPPHSLAKGHSIHVGQKVHHTQIPQSNQNRFDYNLIKNAEPETKISTDLNSNPNLNLNPNYPTAQTAFPTGFPTGYTTGYPSGYKYKNDPFDFLKEMNKGNNNNYEVDKDKPVDYDVFFQNELKGPKKCSKQKVRVYYDEKAASRKIRSAVNKYDVDKFCEQF